MRTLTVPIRRVDALAFSPAGAELAVGGSVPGGVSTGVWVGDRQFLPGCAVRTLAYTPDGRRLLAGVTAATTPYAPDTGLYQLDPGDPDVPPVALPLSVVFAVTADRILGIRVERRATGWEERFACRRLTADGLGPLWDVVPGDRAAGVALLPDGRAVTLTHTPYGGGPPTLTLTLRSADTGRELQSVTPPGHTPGPLMASPAGDRLVLTAGGSLYLWRVADLSAPPVKTTFGKKHCTGVGFLPDGHLLAASNDGTVRRLDPATGATLASYTFTSGKARSLAVAPDGLTAAVGTDRGTVVVFDLD